MGARIAVQIRTEGPRGFIFRIIIVPQGIENAGEQITQQKEQQHESGYFSVRLLPAIVRREDALCVTRTTRTPSETIALFANAMGTQHEPDTYTTQAT